MKISPEPLSPLRAWRELWNAEPLPYDRIIREQATVSTVQWKTTKRPSFHWLSHLINRDTAR
jgi:hypothetical protein